MPVHAPHSRLYHSVPFKHLVKKSGSSHGGRATNIAINLVPFVDMMTMLVCFLLMVFSASGELLQAQRGLELPIAESKQVLQQAPVIIVTNQDITFQGQLISTVEAALRDDNQQFKIEPLYERLDGEAKKIKETVALGNLKDKKLAKACDDAKNNIRPQPGEICPDGLAILQADENTDARLINKIVNTAKAAGFDNLLFAVKNK